MSFFFNRGLWKQKPSMYGPVSAVQRDIWMNAEREGIDPGSIALCMPFWENAGLAVYDYSFCNKYAITQGVDAIGGTWENDAIYFQRNNANNKADYITI